MNQHCSLKKVLERITISLFQFITENYDFFLRATLFLEVDDVLDALPKEAKEFYNKADSSVQDSLQNEVLSVYGHDVDKVSCSYFNFSTYNFGKAS